MAGQPPKKPGRPPKSEDGKGGSQPSKKTMAYWTDFFPVSGSDPYYRNCNSPLDFILRVMNDERKHESLRYQAALDAAPYTHSKPANKPYAPTEEERREIEERRRLIVEVRTFADPLDDEDED